MAGSSKAQQCEHDRGATKDSDPGVVVNDVCEDTTQPAFGLAILALGGRQRRRLINVAGSLRKIRREHCTGLRSNVTTSVL